jgi:spore coat polysaccharide biosynthesis protein SpsF
MGSTRLPGKVLLDIGGLPMLARVLRRTSRAALLDEVVVATSRAPADDPIARAAAALGARVVRGSEDDVLLRYREAADASGADLIVRITADCPLIDPALIDQTIDAFRTAAPPVEFAANTLVRTFPRGLDVEVLSRALLDTLDREAPAGYHRAHVTSFVYENAERFRTRSVEQPRALGHLRWTVDTPDDLAAVRALYERLGNRDAFTWQQALACVEADPQLAGLNQHVAQRQPREG